MVDKNATGYNVKPFSYTPKPRTPGQQKYWFLDDKLYKTLTQDRAQDLLRAWSFDDDKIVEFLLSDAKRKMKNAYDTREVAAMLNRSSRMIQQYVIDAQIEQPRRVNYNGAVNKYGYPFYQRKWKDSDIIALHEYLLYSGAGRPRKDGVLYSATRIPTRSELLAILRNQPMFYMRSSTGEMIPVWSAYDEV